MNSNRSHQYRSAGKAFITRSLTKESHIENAIVQAMELDGWRAFKMEENFSERKKKKTGEPGMCDHLFIRYRYGTIPFEGKGWTEAYMRASTAQVLWWEFKAAKAVRKKVGFLDSDQVSWIARERSKGALIWAAGVDHPATIAGAAAHYLASGLCRRRELFLKLIPAEDRPVA